LSHRFTYLDNYNKTSNIRVRDGFWPEVEQVPFTWQQRVEARGGLTSGELLQAKAKEIWVQLPQLADKPVPEFSVGWLEGFKRHFKISSKIRHGEAASITSLIEEEMKALQTVAGEYQEDDIYNMDESSLFWRMMPSQGLSTQSQAGLKKDKSRISLVFCVNATGTDRLPVWFIGKAKTPCALRNVSVPTMGGQWRWNKKAWMNTTVMVEWLQAFYQWIGTTRQVLLTMDNFSAHYSAVELCSPPSNIQICWLPANSTSRFQPLDQGIIQNCKAYYRRHWLQYILQSFETDINPHLSMNLHLAVRWILRSWNNEITNTTIYNCFRKSTLVLSPISLPTPIIPSGVTELYRQVMEVGNIRDAMTISNFLNPVDEAEEEEEPTIMEEEVLQEVLQEHLGFESIQYEDEEEEQPVKPVYSVSDALQALHLLIEFTEGQESLSTAYLRALERLESVIEGIQQGSLVQNTLDSWLR
jgi:DDE superfamily endonuclease/Tc5 transposase DNA-binding domain